MDEVNYHEQVVVPFFHKRCQDLLNGNLLLEATLLVEQQKVKNLEQQLQTVAEEYSTKLQEVQQEYSTKLSTEQQSRQEVENNLKIVRQQLVQSEQFKQDLQNNLNQLAQSKNNEVGQQAQQVVQLQNQVQELTNIANDRANTIAINRNSIKEQQAIIEDLKKQLNTATAEIQVLKTPVSKKKKAQPKEEILDGDVF